MKLRFQLGNRFLSRTDTESNSGESWITMKNRMVIQLYSVLFDDCYSSLDIPLDVKIFKTYIPADKIIKPLAIKFHINLAP